jgi:hypothetical protein
MKKWSANTRTRSSLTIFVVPILAFSLTSIAILKSNTVSGMDAYAPKSNEPSIGESSIGSNSYTGGKNAAASSGSSSGSDTKSSPDSTNCEANSINKKNDYALNDGSNKGTNNNFKSVEPPKAGKGEQGSRPIVQPDKPVKSLPPPITTSSCEQGSPCINHHQQDLSDHNPLTTATKDNKTPFILSVPFP